MKVRGKSLEMVRGDSETLTISCVDTAGLPVDFEEGDTVYFTVRETVMSKTITLQKIATEFVDGKAIIEIVPDDTKLLKFRPFVYDIQVTKANGVVTTIIPPSPFIVGGEVTYD